MYPCISLYWLLRSSALKEATFITVHSKAQLPCSSNFLVSDTAPQSPSWKRVLTFLRPCIPHASGTQRCGGYRLWGIKSAWKRPRRWVPKSDEVVNTAPLFPRRSLWASFVCLGSPSTPHPGFSQEIPNGLPKPFSLFQETLEGVQFTTVALR